MSRHVGICACGKRSYASRSEARSVSAAEHPTEHLAAYRCGDYWHIGHLPGDVRRGRATRDQIGLRNVARAEKRFRDALRAWLANPADGLVWLRSIAAREALAKCIDRHPAGRASR